MIPLCVQLHQLKSPQENDGLEVSPTLMEVDPAFDPDVCMPGMYPEGLSPNPPSTGPSMNPMRRTQRAPAWFRDILPEPPQAIPASIPQPQLPAVYLIVTNPLKTALNSFGLFRQYLFHPTHDPDALVNPSDLSNLAPPIPCSPFKIKSGKP